MHTSNRVLVADVLEGHLGVMLVGCRCPSTSTLEEFGTLGQLGMESLPNSGAAGSQLSQRVGFSEGKSCFLVSALRERP
jgi:hypothetical protein